MREKQKLFSIFILLFTLSIPLISFADGAFTGTLNGVDRNSGYLKIDTTSGSVFVPGSTSFEGGAVNGTVYKCTYVGTTNKVTSADCKLKTAVVKGNLAQNVSGGYSLTDINDDAKIIAQLPSNVVFQGGSITVGSYYLCNYTGSLPRVSSASCSIDTVASPIADPNKNVTFRLFYTNGSPLTCPQAEALTCWISFAFGWSQNAIILLAVGAIIGAGIIYMTSAGNPKRTAIAKKMLVGALSGVAVIVLGRFFLTKVIGVPWL